MKWWEQYLTLFELLSIAVGHVHLEVRVRVRTRALSIGGIYTGQEWIRVQVQRVFQILLGPNAKPEQYLTPIGWGWRVQLCGGRREDAFVHSQKALNTVWEKAGRWGWREEQNQGGHWVLHQYPPLGKIPKYLPNTLPQKNSKNLPFPPKNTKIPPQLPKCEICGLQPRKKSYQ